MGRVILPSHKKRPSLSRKDSIHPPLAGLLKCPMSRTEKRSHQDECTWASTAKRKPRAKLMHEKVSETVTRRVWANSANSNSSLLSRCVTNDTVHKQPAVSSQWHTIPFGKSKDAFQCQELILILTSQEKSAGQRAKHQPQVLQEEQNVHTWSTHACARTDFCGFLI